jgi:ABC-type hemin transport system ATPase subunit
MHKYLIAGLVLCGCVWGQVKQFVKVDAPVVALTHVLVIDGTGAPARDDQIVVLAKGKIQAVGAVDVPKDA